MIQTLTKTMKEKQGELDAFTEKYDIKPAVCYHYFSTLETFKVKEIKKKSEFIGDFLGRKDCGPKMLSKIFPIHL